MKKYLAGFLTALFLVVGIHATNEVRAILKPELKIQLEDKTIELRDANNKLITPVIIDGSTYLPVRALSQALDLFVDYDGATQTVKLSKNPLIKKDYLSPNELWKVDNLLKVKVLSAQRVTSTDLYKDADPEELIMITYEVENIGDDASSGLGLQVPLDTQAKILKQGKEDKSVERVLGSLLTDVNKSTNSFVKKGETIALKGFYKIDKNAEVDSIRFELYAYNKELTDKFTQVFVVPVTAFKK